MTKILKQLSYIERCRMFISQMQESNWIDDGPTPPTPGGFTKIKVGDTLNAVQISLDADVYANALKNIDWSKATESEGIKAIFMPSNDKPALIFGNLPKEMTGLDKDAQIVVGNGSLQQIYASDDLQMMGMVKGIQPGIYDILEDTDKMRLASDVEVETALDTQFDEYLNGVVCGYAHLEPGPTPSLTKITDGSTIDGIEVNFDTFNLCSDFIANFGTIEPDTEWGKALVSRYDAEGNEPIITINDMTGEGAVVLMIQDSGNTGILNQYWFTPNDLDMGGPIIPKGWNRIDPNEGGMPTVVPVSGNFSFNFPDGLQMVVSDKFTDDINGVVFGAITE